MPDVAHLSVIVTACAFALAFVLGAVAYRVSFCTIGAITDVVNFGDWRRMRMWLLAIAVAIAGAAALHDAGLIDVSKSLYTGARVAWLSHLIGGFLFGVGMTLASGCGSKTLIRAGAGNLKSLIVLAFLAIAAYMTLKGAFAPWRVYALDSVRFDVGKFGAATSDLPALAAAWDCRRWRSRRARSAGKGLARSRTSGTTSSAVCSWASAASPRSGVRSVKA